MSAGANCSRAKPQPVDLWSFSSSKHPTQPVRRTIRPANTGTEQATGSAEQAETMRRLTLLYAIAATSAWQPLRPKTITRTKQYVTVPWLPAPRARRRREGTLASAMTKTAKRIFLPTTIISAVAYVAFAPLAQLTHNLLGRKTALLIGNSDLAKTVPGVLGLLFSVVASNTFTALYEQQEAAHLAVYAEVSCARSLLEQLVLVLGGPGEPRCRSALRAFRRYVGDLEQDVGDPRRGPAKRLTIGAPVPMRRPSFIVSHVTHRSTRPRSSSGTPSRSCSTRRPSACPRRTSTSPSRTRARRGRDG